MIEKGSIADLINNRLEEVEEEIDNLNLIPEDFKFSYEAEDRDEHDIVNTKKNIIKTEVTYNLRTKLSRRYKSLGEKVVMEHICKTNKTICPKELYDIYIIYYKEVFRQMKMPFSLSKNIRVEGLGVFKHKPYKIIKELNKQLGIRKWLLKTKGNLDTFDTIYYEYIKEVYRTKLSNLSFGKIRAGMYTWSGKQIGYKQRREINAKRKATKEISLEDQKLNNYF